ncbi:MAG TPA: SDR family NAD(P)-dependent oxidoreductase, partial [Steroidobacteraceae bacterium]|nr:SDR family NAD(P)-dependent oxidoreductase [Steroidobacteraceae bacterium]
MGTFTGKTILITGASEGIGRALALALAPQRPRLALVARSATRLESAARECTALGAEAVALPADLARPGDCARVVQLATERFGGLDVLVNNAGVTMLSRFEAVSDLGVFGHLLAVNYLAAVHLTAAALPHLRRTRG